MIKVVPFNETFVKVVIDDYGIEQEFSDFFTFFSKGYKFAPSYRNGMWDGKIRLYNARTKVIYRGLLKIIMKFAKLNSYQLVIDESLYPYDNTFNLEEFTQFSKDLNIAVKGEPEVIRDYQITAASQAAKAYRKILISPTASGKSLIIYSLMRWFLHKNPDEKIILVVPTTSLVEQMFSDFFDYSTLNGWVAEDNVQLLYSGKDRVFSKSIMISTWQSLHAMKKNDPKAFKAITSQTTIGIFDEAHTYKADEVRSTIEQFVEMPRRIGTTGTLDDSKVNELVLTGLLGDPYVVKTTRQLIDEGFLTDIKVQIVKLKYPEHVCKEMKGSDYETEFNFIIGSQERNQFIKNLALSCKGVTLVTFSLVERHGKILHALIKEAGTDRNVYLIYGGVDVEERERIRQVANNDPSAIIVASEKTFSTGINLPGITNVILTVPRKSSILIRQTIGRGLRKFPGKDYMTLFDISDDLTVGSRKNVTLRSLDERMSIYIKDQFQFQVRTVNLEQFQAPQKLDI